MDFSSRVCQAFFKELYVDVSAVCHEVRSLEFRNGEQACISVRDTHQAEKETSGPLGKPCHCRSMEVDSTLLIRVWAVRDEAAKVTEGRLCGEVRVPLQRVGGMLYHTWLSLESPGLRDSVASVGFGDSNDIADYDQALTDGPRRLFQPRVCLTVCKTSDLGPSGRVILSGDTPNESRVAQWAGLLRSQQQHEIMSKALHLQGETEARRSLVAGQDLSPQPAEELRERVQDQMEAIARLRMKLERFHESSQQPVGASKFPPARVQPAGKADVSHLHAEMETVSAEANDRIDSANERIRLLRQDRDQARSECEMLTADRVQLVQQRDASLAQQQELSAQKEALLGIVEDLMQTCSAAGLHQARQSIDSITRLGLN